jgi:hypothetical protein
VKEDRISAQIDPQEHFNTALEQTLREGAQRLLQLAIENEVHGFLHQHLEARMADGRLSVIRNGYSSRAEHSNRIGTNPYQAA